MDTVKATEVFDDFDCIDLSGRTNLMTLECKAARGSRYDDWYFFSMRGGCTLEELKDYMLERYGAVYTMTRKGRHCFKVFAGDSCIGYMRVTEWELVD